MSDNKINKDFSFYPEKVIPIVKEQFQNEFNMLAELWKKEEKYDFTPLDAISNIENFRISFNEDPRFRQLIEYTISNNDDVRNALIEAGTIKTKLDTIPENEDNKRDPEPQPSKKNFTIKGVDNNTISFETNNSNGSHNLFVINALKFEKYIPPGLNLLPLITERYLEDKIAIKTFFLGDEKTLDINLGIDKDTAETWNQFFDKPIFQEQEYEYTQEEINAGFYVVVIYTSDGGVFAKDFSNIKYEYKMQTYLLNPVKPQPEPKKKGFFKKALPYILTALGSFGLSYLLFNDDCDENSGRMIDGKSIKELTISECEEACNKRIEQIKDQIQDNVENIETGSLIED